jgi:hypothetical protein
MSDNEDEHSDQEVDTSKAVPNATGRAPATSRGPLMQVTGPFSDSKPTIAFDYPEYTAERRQMDAGICIQHYIYNRLVISFSFFVLHFFTVPVNAAGASNPVHATFFHADDVHRYNSALNAWKRNGVRETTTSAWNLYWGKYLQPEEYAQMLPFQRANHFAGSLEIGHKGRLLFNLNRFRRTHGVHEYDFVPESFSLPRDFDSFERSFHAAAAMSSTSSSTATSKLVTEPIWIVKPPNSSCGRGIYLATKLSEVPKDKACVVSRYISNPYLINNRKFDLRIYVCVTSLSPLRIYLYDDGLARFATKEFDLRRSNLAKRYIHLTNFRYFCPIESLFQSVISHVMHAAFCRSVNKKAAEFERNKNADQGDTGSKWSFQALLAYLAKQGVDPKSVVDSISDVIIKTIIAVEPTMASTQMRLNCGQNSCFEMFGYDILLDANLRPWIMEVNCFASLSSSAPLDKKMKTMLLCDIFHMVGLDPVDVKEYLKNEKIDQDEKAKRRWMGLDKDSGVVAHAPTALSLTDLQKFFGSTTTASTQTTERLLSRCSPADWFMLRRIYEENTRCGRFNRIFPTPQTQTRYGHLFETQRHGNLLMSLFLRLPAHQWLSTLQLPNPSALVLNGPLSPVAAHRRSEHSDAPSPSHKLTHAASVPLTAAALHSHQHHLAPSAAPLSQTAAMLAAATSPAVPTQSSSTTRFDFPSAFNPNGVGNAAPRNLRPASGLSITSARRPESGAQVASQFSSQFVSRNRVPSARESPPLTALTVDGLEIPGPLPDDFVIVSSSRTEHRPEPASSFFLPAAPSPAHPRPVTQGLHSTPHSSMLDAAYLVSAQRVLTQRHPLIGSLQQHALNTASMTSQKRVPARVGSLDAIPLSHSMYTAARPAVSSQASRAAVQAPSLSALTIGFNQLNMNRAPSRQHDAVNFRTAGTRR